MMILARWILTLRIWCGILPALAEEPPKPEITDYLVNQYADKKARSVSIQGQKEETRGSKGTHGNSTLTRMLFALRVRQT